MKDTKNKKEKLPADVERARSEMLRNLKERFIATPHKRIRTLAAQGASKEHLDILRAKPEKKKEKKE